MLVSLISQKGGVCKSGLARLIAVEYVRAGWSVKIADLDIMQASTTKWKSRRDRNGITPEVNVEKYATVERAISDAQHYDLMVLDGPAFAEKGGLTMAQASDLVLMPTGYSLDDMEPQVETAYDLHSAGVDPEKIAFVFTLVDGSLSEDAAARRYLGKAGMNVMENVMPQYPAIRQAMNSGRAASEVSHPDVKRRVLPLAQEIANTLKNTQTETKQWPITA